MAAYNLGDAFAPKNAGFLERMLEIMRPSLELMEVMRDRVAELKPEVIVI